MTDKEIIAFHNKYCSKAFCDNNCPLLSTDDLHCHYDDLIEGNEIPTGRYKTKSESKYMKKKRGEKY